MRIDNTFLTDRCSENESDIIFINGAYYKYVYNKPDDYTYAENNTDNSLSEIPAKSVVSGRSATSEAGGAIYNQATRL